MSARFGRYRVLLDARGEKNDYTVGTWGGPEKAVALAVLEHHRCKRRKSIPAVSVDSLEGDEYQPGHLAIGGNGE